MIQFHHNREFNSHDFEISPKGGETIALDVFEPWLFDELKIGDCLDKRFGIAKCSKSDNFNKKIGRELATSRLKISTLMVVRKQDNLIVLTNNTHRFILKKCLSGKVHLREAYLDE